MTEITLTLPDELVQQAKAAGLLDPERIQSLLEAELKQRREGAERFFDAMDRMSLESGLTPEEIEAEIQAYKDEEYASETDTK